MSNTLFALPKIADFFAWIDRGLNSYTVTTTIDLAGFPLRVRWTRRAQRAFARLEKPLNVEMQLYFSCLVKKRIIFHERGQQDYVSVHEKLALKFRPVQAAACDPEAFAKNYPEKRELDSDAAKRMHPKVLSLDFKNDVWVGEFLI